MIMIIVFSILVSLMNMKRKAKEVPQHTYRGAGGRGAIAPTRS
jgi:hypothetical protein